jgi:hypothetical protein
MKGAYTPELTPVAYYDQPVLLDDGSDQNLARVEQVAPLIGIETQAFTVPSNDQINNVDVDALEIWDGWFAQYRPVGLQDELPDGVEMTIDHGSNNSPLYQAKQSRGAVSEDTVVTGVDDGSYGEVDDLSYLHELYVLEDEVPKFSFKNTTGSDETFSITFTGFCFNITPIRSADGQPIYLPVAAIRGGV